MMNKQTQKPEKKSSFLQKCIHVATTWVAPAWPFWPHKKRIKLSHLLAVLVANSIAYEMTTPLLKTSTDLAEEMEIDESIFEALNSERTVYVQGNDLFSRIHSSVRFPGVIGVANYAVDYKTTGAYAESAFDYKFLDTEFVTKISPYCRVNLSRTFDILAEYNKEYGGSFPTAIQDADDYKKTPLSNLPVNLRDAVLKTIFHEVRHCSHANTTASSREWDADHHAETAMAMHHSEDKNRKHDERLRSAYEDLGIFEYDNALYSYYLDQGLDMPPLDEIDQANRDAFAFIREHFGAYNNTFDWKMRDLTPQGMAFFMESLPKDTVSKMTFQKRSKISLSGQALPDNYAVSAGETMDIKFEGEDFSALSPLAQKRVMLYVAGILLDGKTDNLWRTIAKDNTLKIHPRVSTPGLKPARLKTPS